MENSNSCDTNPRLQKTKKKADSFLSEKKNQNSLFSGGVHSENIGRGAKAVKSW